MVGTTIYTIVAAAVGGASITLVGVLAVAWVKGHRTRKTTAQRRAEERLAAEVLRSLGGLTSRVAGDVESHSNQIAEVSARLANDEFGTSIVKDAVRRLLKANQQVQEKLSHTEDQLRNQAVKLEAHASAARTDSLTLLGNRRAMEEQFHRFMSDFREHGCGFSLVHMDLDEFKMLNDAYGHAAGDEVLRGLAKILRRCAPENAFVARPGSEEFTLLIPHAPLYEACAATEVTRAAVKACSFPYNGNNLSITASFGVAQIREGEEAASLYHRADRALYTAKHNGRDCVYWHDGERFGKGLPAAVETEASVERFQPQPAAEALSADSAAAPPAASGPAAEPSRDCFGLPNRTMFCNSVRTRVCEWKRGGSAFSILLLKIQQRGKSEPEGARSVPLPALQAAATLIQSVVRDMDLVGYYAQACFSLLMPGVDPLASSDIAKRLEEQLSHLATNVSGMPPMDLHVGAAVVTQRDDTVSLLKRAENDLRVGSSSRQPRRTVATATQ